MGWNFRATSSNTLYLENFDGVEDDRVYAAELLEQH